MTQSAEANVFAAELSAADVGANFDISFRLNEDATAGVTVNVYDTTPALIKTINAGNLSAGPNTVQWDKTDNSSAAVPSGDYTFEVEAAATGYAGWTQISDNNSKWVNFYSPRGVTVEANQELETFGRIFVAEATAGTSTATPARTTAGAGIFVLSNDMDDILGVVDTPATGGVGWVTGSSPCDVDSTGDGRLIISDWTDSHSGIYCFPDNSDMNTATYLFDGSFTRAASGLVTDGSANEIHGSIRLLTLEGTGSALTAYWVDEDMDGGTVQVKSLLIGNNTSGMTTVPTAAWADVPNLIQSSQTNVMPDGSGGYWLTQRRYTESAAVPAVVHVDSSGTVDFNSFNDGPAVNTFWVNYNGASAMLDSNTFVMGNQSGGIWTVDVSDYLNGVVATDTGIDFGQSINDIEVGPAGNVYVTNSSDEYLFVISPAGANSFTTSSPASVTMTVVSSVDEWTQY